MKFMMNVEVWVNQGDSEETREEILEGLRGQIFYGLLEVMDSDFEIEGVRVDALEEESEF